MFKNWLFIQVAGSIYSGAEKHNLGDTAPESAVGARYVSKPKS